MRTRHASYDANGDDKKQPKENEEDDQHQQTSPSATAAAASATHSPSLEEGAIADDEGLAYQTTKLPVGRRLPRPPRKSTMKSSKSATNNNTPGENKKQGTKHVTISAPRTPSPLSPVQPLARGSDASGEDNGATETSGASDSDHRHPGVATSTSTSGGRGKSRGASGDKNKQNNKREGRKLKAAAKEVSARSSTTAAGGGGKDSEDEERNSQDTGGSEDEKEEGQKEEQDTKEEDGNSSSDDSSDSSDDDDSSDSSDGDDEDDKDDEEKAKELVSQAEIAHAIALASEAAAKTFGWDRTKMGVGSGGSAASSKASKNKKKGSRAEGGEGNVLSDLIPGYTAPMRLEVTYAPSAEPKSLEELRRRAQQTDLSTSTNVATSVQQQKRAAAMRKRNPGGMGGGASSFKLGTKRPPDNTAGSGWFGMVPTALTDDVKADIAVIRNRAYLDPKRFYKKSDVINPKFVQVGTVIEGAGEYYSSRLTKKQRRQNIAEEIMADRDVASYAKKQFNKVQTSRQGRFDQGYGRKKQRRSGGGKRRGRR